MMNGTPKKHSFSSSEDKRGKQTRGWGRTTEGKDKMGVCVGVCVDMHGEYIILFQSGTVPCDKVQCDTGGKQRYIDSNKLTFTVPPL